MSMISYIIKTKKIDANNNIELLTYDYRGSVSAVIGSYGDFRATYWYDGLGNVKSQTYGYGVFGSGKKYYGYNAEQYNPVTGNQNLRNRQVNIRRQRFLTEDTYLGNKNNPLTINRYVYANDNPLRYADPNGKYSLIVQGGIDSNIGAGGGTSIGIAIGWNTQTGFEFKVVGASSLSVTSSIGGTATAGLGIDWTNTPIGTSRLHTIGGSGSIGKGIGIVAGGDLNFDAQTLMPTGININVGGTASVTPFTFALGPIPVDFEGHVKETWGYELFDLKSFISDAAYNVTSCVGRMIDSIQNVFATHKCGGNS